MAFSMIDGAVSTEVSFEHSVLQLCEEIPNLYVYVANNVRALNASLLFFIELPISVRKKYKILDDRYELLFENGSIIRFVGVKDGLASATMPEEGAVIHILMTYNVSNRPVLKELMSSVKEYDRELPEKYIGLLPLMKEEDNVFAGDDFYAEFKSTVIREKLHSARKTIGKQKNVIDLSKYPKAQQILSEIDILEQQLEYEFSVKRDAIPDLIRHNNQLGIVRDRAEKT